MVTIVLLFIVESPTAERMRTTFYHFLGGTKNMIETCPLHCSEDVLKGALTKMIIKSKFIKIDSPPYEISDSIGI